MAFDTVIDKVQLESALTATANAIRGKTGGTDSIVWDAEAGFAEAVSGLTTEEINPPGVIPANLKAAAMEIVEKVRAVRKTDSIVFLAMSDSHHTGEQSDTGWQALTNLGNLHAGMAAKVLSYGLDLDFVCHLGDLTFGHGTTTSALLHQQVGEMNLWLDEAWKGIPRFQTVGNHDTGMYAVSNGTEAALESNDYLFSAFGKYCEGAVYGSETYGYCYRDFESRKLRVICLNTSEGDSISGSGYECSPAQLLWFAQTLKSVGAKSGWGVIVLGHYPLDYPGMHDATAIVKAYVEGSSITVNGTAVNFSGSNLARFIANFHGHTHCFKVARLNELNTSTMKATEYDAWRVGIPNSGFYRNNHQEGPNAYGLYFEEETTYDKVNDGVNDTAFVVNVITPSEEVIHSFCYGAGYDRAIGYGAAAWYRVTSALSNCTMTASASNVAEGNPFMATISPDEHCDVSSVTVTMGGVDITASCYSEGKISIASVTGNIVITAKAIVALACVNQIPISTDDSGASYGYKAGYRLYYGELSERSGSYATGFIPAKPGDVVRLRNVKYEKVASGALPTHEQRIEFYDADKNYIGFVNSAGTAFHYRVFEGDILVQFTLAQAASTELTNVAFFRLNAAYIGDDSIITVNEEIKYADEVDSWVITNVLTNVTSNNTAATVDKDASYTATITVNSGCTLETVRVTMGGVDITSTVYSNGVITIPSVNGNVVITAFASVDAARYTNLLPISTDASGTVYNGKGYKENTYMSGGNEGTSSGIYCSGYIPIPAPIDGYSNIVYFQNVGMKSGQDKHRIALFLPDKTFKSIQKTTVASGFTFGDDGNVEKYSIAANILPNGGFIRFCCGYLGADSIVTVNEPIE